MLLNISTTHTPATDLSFLLHKHPDKLQSVDLSSGKAHIFYPEANQERCAACLLLDINPIELVKNSRNNNNDFALAHYVNDRPYVASSFMSVAISKAFSTALNGKCSKRPELVDQVMPFQVTISVLPAPKGGEFLIRKLFEPLGYDVNLERYQLDSTFPEWGESKYYTLQLSGKFKLKDLLSHLYVLIPSLDNNKHYWISQSEVEKLLQKGEGWLGNHPEKEQITKRYLKGIGGLTRNALDRLLDGDGDENSPEAEESNPEVDEVKETLHQQRLRQTFQELKISGAKSVVDLGCGEGKLLKMLLKEKQFERILGMDVSYRTLEKAVERLHYDEMPPKQKERINLIQGALTYRDKRLDGFDAAAIIEVIEHLDLNRLKAFERVIFQFSKPKVVVLTTPNKEYNQLFETMALDSFRHADHRFEWTRKEFRDWAENAANANGYQVEIKSVGEEDKNVGAPSQMAIFKLNNHE
ncbi:3' terminal RNA ribose 2'-O-methyltransferase Hen1 [Fulvivirgaceae bacterium BMA12]|uniref:Small RNA 2'-O-methyltransferase n=1 Tax=Agaribacillus aureus TaxID=3051825 RepID=A0ABT8LF28_9BACT|nr:3' terminal RNA ribose 2'-O-methyltransferase Hen1 [Fulvivirgaceae bacterium BMA12]